MACLRLLAVVQVINTGFDVAEKQLDIMMAAGENACLPLFVRPSAPRLMEKGCSQYDGKDTRQWSLTCCGLLPVTV